MAEGASNVKLALSPGLKLMLVLGRIGLSRSLRPNAEVAMNALLVVNA